MNGRMLQRIQLGSCYADLLQVQDDGEERWLVFLLSPRGIRFDTLSHVMRTEGGQLFFLNDKVGLAYNQPEDAEQALQRLVELVHQGMGSAEHSLN